MRIYSDMENFVFHNFHPASRSTVNRPNSLRFPLLRRLPLRLQVNLYLSAAHLPFSIRHTQMPDSLRKCLMVRPSLAQSAVARDIYRLRWCYD